MSSTRLTNNEKAYYSIEMASGGVWAGRCPDCRKRLIATDMTVSQIGVVAAIERHREDEHK